jgi:hypothetical protein
MVECLYTSILDLGTRWRHVVSSTSWKRDPRVHWAGDWVGFKANWTAPAANQTSVVELTARSYTDWTVSSPKREKELWGGFQGNVRIKVSLGDSKKLGSEQDNWWEVEVFCDYAAEETMSKPSLGLDGEIDGHTGANCFKEKFLC